MAFNISYLGSNIWPTLLWLKGLQKFNIYCGFNVAMPKSLY